MYTAEVQPGLWRWLRLWWRVKWSKKNMTSISVGLRNDGSIDVDMAPKTEGGEEEEWTFGNITLEEAEFLRDELDEAIKRAKAKGLPKPKPAPEPAKSE